MREHTRRLPTPFSSPDNRHRQMKGPQFDLPIRPMVSPQTTSPSTSTSSLSTPSSPSPPAKRVRFSEPSKKDIKIKKIPESSSTHTLPMRPRASSPSRNDPSTQGQEPSIPPKCPEVPGQKRHERQLKKHSRRTKRFEPSATQKRLESEKHQQHRDPKARQQRHQAPKYDYDPERDPDEVDEAFFLQKKDKDIKSHYEEKRLAAMAHMTDSAERRQRPGMRVDDALRTKGSYERLRP